MLEELSGKRSEKFVSLPAMLDYPLQHGYSQFCIIPLKCAVDEVWERLLNINQW